MIAIVVAFIGFIDATYLTAMYYLGATPACSVLRCELVTTSEYATVFGLPIALFGALYYLTAIVLLAAYIDKKDIRFLRVFFLITILSFFFTLWLVYLQLFVIKAICLYCMISATTSTILFLFAIYFLATWKKTSPTSNSSLPASLEEK